MDKNELLMNIYKIHTTHLGISRIKRNLGIEEDDEIVNVPVSIDRMSRCKLVLDDDRVIELSVDDYLEGVDISREMDERGLTRIILKNIKDVVVK